jgi:DNA-binding MarR family transcriptional regulator
LLELDRDGSLTQLDLGNRLRLEKSTVSRLVGQLADRGWLRRIKVAGDARLTWLELTEPGRSTARQLAAARTARFEQLLSRLPVGRRADVIEALTLLVAAADAPAPAGDQSVTAPRRGTV